MIYKKAGAGLFTALPATSDEFLPWTWTQIETYYHDLENRPLNAVALNGWMADWSALTSLIEESYHRLEVATAQNTTDEQAVKSYHSFLEHIYQPAETEEQKLKQKLLQSGLEPDNFFIPLRNLRAEADLFREANVPLNFEEHKLSSDYDKIIGAQTVEWEGKEVTISQLAPYYLLDDRHLREKAWTLASRRQLADRAAINELWGKFLRLRRQKAANAGLPDFREYRWRQMLRFDYTPADCASFQQAILKVVVPAAVKIYEKRRRRLGYPTLRPWDLEVDPLKRTPLRPFTQADELQNGTSRIFHRLDPELGRYFDVMRKENLLDLDNRKGKAPGGFCTGFEVRRRPFILMNAVGLDNDLYTLLHESGHAFHVFESAHLPYIQQWRVGMEFAEVASMAMELLAAPYLQAEQGGFYADNDMARSRIEHLEKNILFWPYMAVVDSFQHWVYANPEAASDPVQCDKKWGEQWDQYMPGVDWSGLEEAKITGWHRKLHIHHYPFYYVEYGLAQLGAALVWRNSLRDRRAALTAYRQALGVGGTAPLPQLYAAAGARFAFDVSALQEAVELMLSTIETLEK